MNPAESILRADNGGNIINLLEQYVISCNTESLKDNSKASSKSKQGFPNLAGFCRFIKISASELESFGRENPEIYGRILAILEDEALNSAISPTVISAYLKKRLGYEAVKHHTDQTQLEIKFDHDIFEDGG